MQKEFDLEAYLSKGVENIIKGAIKATLKNPKESIFIAKYASSSIYSRKIRMEYEKNNIHIPPFLIASITSSCNLHCSGCYARANNSCNDHASKDQLMDLEWKKIFTESSELGIGFILLAGGEPFMRQDVITTAAEFKNIIFPIFTNGTMMNENYLNIFDKNRNLIPVLSIEGDQENTDRRRGEGVYTNLITTMNEMNSKGILFGASITVTKENIHNVTSESFISELYKRGCKVIFFVEYVPISSESKGLAPTDVERKYLDEMLVGLRQNYEGIVFVSFPGDEKTSGGCLAAGRGFFHINSNGNAEPCPFSPYSDTNLRNVTVLEALRSPLFRKLNDGHLLLQEHQGGCVLFEHEEQVKQMCV